MGSGAARQGAAATAWAAARRGSPATAPNRNPVPKFGRDGTYGRELALSWGFPLLGCLERLLPSAAELGPAAAHGAGTAPAWGGPACVRTVVSASRRLRCWARVGGTCSCACRTGPSRPAARRSGARRRCDARRRCEDGAVREKRNGGESALAATAAVAPAQTSLPAWHDGRHHQRRRRGGKVGMACARSRGSKAGSTTEG
jgi:hypothetical protein